MYEATLGDLLHFLAGYGNEGKNYTTLNFCNEDLDVPLSQILADFEQEC